MKLNGKEYRSWAEFHGVAQTTDHSITSLDIDTCNLRKCAPNHLARSRHVSYAKALTQSPRSKSTRVIGGGAHIT